MAEPEDVVAEGALLATRVVRELWAHRPGERPDPPPGLSDVRRRLEFFVAACVPNAPEIGVADPPARLNMLARLARRRTAHLLPLAAMASTDGDRIRLPETLDGADADAILPRYQLLALQQATRATRGTVRCISPSSTPLLRDLYLLAEAAAIDATLVALLPRLAAGLVEARRESGAGCAPIPRPSQQELAMEALLHALLAADPAFPPPPFVIATSPEDSLRWATEQHEQLRRLEGPHRGLPPIPVWGIVTELEPVATAGNEAFTAAPSTPATRSHQLPRRPTVREPAADEDDSEPGTWIVRADDAQEKAEDPAGLQRPADRDEQADPGELADALSELPEARLVHSPAVVHEVLVGDDPIRRVGASDGGRRPGGIVYPEWDCYTARYRMAGAIVRERDGENGEDAWVDAMLRRHATTLRRVRRDFERVRPRRTALKRQRDGSDVDVDAVVEAYADRRGGGATDDRLHVDTRPVRRDVAISLLVDASASTDSWVAGNRRIIDVEKEALLIVAEALDALGDPHAILAFSGEGPESVEVQHIMALAGRETPGEIRRRIAGLEPSGYTRAGAAIRHATAGLLQHAARHRLLLLLSDGRPNDVDQYEGRYGVEDTRAAVVEARLQGLHCCCLTVDREAPRYATRIFGRDFAVLTRAERLPAALTGLLRDLLRS